MRVFAIADLLLGMQTEIKSQAGERTQSDDQIIEKHNRSVRNRARIELEIIHALIKALRKDGYEVRVNDGEEPASVGSEQELVTKIFGTDGARIETRKTGCKNSFVYLVLGNSGHDVICDYGVSLEPVLEPLNNWIDAQIDSGKF